MLVKFQISNFILLTFSFLLFSCKKPNITEIQKEIFVKYFGSVGNNQGNKVLQTADGGYILAATIEEDSVGTQMSMIKTDAYGNKEWQQIYGSRFNDLAATVQIMPDGYLLIGSISDSIQTDILLVKTNFSGNLIYEKKIGSKYNENPTCIVEALNGGYIIGVNTYEPDAAHEKPTIQLLFINENCDSLRVQNWDSPGYSQQISSLSINPNGGYLACGTSDKNGSKDVLFALVNSFGISSDIVFLGGIQNETGVDVAAVENGYLVLGNTESFGSGKKDIYLVNLATNNIHTPLVSNYFGGIKDDIAYAMKKTNDNSFVICGSSVNSDRTESDIFILKVNQSGNEISTNYIGHNGIEAAISLDICSDNGCIITGYNRMNDNSVISLIKTNSNGILE